MFQCNEEKDLDDDHGGIPGRPSIWVSTNTIWYALSFVSADIPQALREIDIV